MGDGGWHILGGGCTIPLLDFSLGSSVLELWVQGGKREAGKARRITEFESRQK